MTVPQPLRLVSEAAPRDVALVARIKSGERAAFEELFRAYYDELTGFAARVLGDSAEAEEVVQDVFLAIWKHRERGAFDPQNISAYLHGAVRKSATSRLRHLVVEKHWAERAEHDSELHLIAPTESADAQTRYNDLMAAVREVVAELPPRCRQAFLLRRQHGLSYNEIAQVMGIAPKTVEVQIGAALRTLRARLTRFYE